jgi:hypothetical protein
VAITHFQALRKRLMTTTDDRIRDCGSERLPLCCRSNFSVVDAKALVGQAMLGPLLGVGAFERRLSNLPPAVLPAIRRFVADAVGKPLLGIGLIGSFTYDPFGWDDLDVVALTALDEPELSVVHECRPDVSLTSLRIDLITLSRGAMEDCERFGDETMPAFCDSRGRRYETLCTRLRCMAGSLNLMVWFGHWLEAPILGDGWRYASSPRGAICAARLLDEARSYMTDPGDALKGLRRLYLAAQVLRRFGQVVDSASIEPLLWLGSKGGSIAVWRELQAEGGAVSQALTHQIDSCAATLLAR